MSSRFENTASTRSHEPQPTSADSASNARTSLPASLPLLSTPNADMFSSPPSSRWSTASYVPDSYEPRYAYPLIVWFHNNGGTEQQLHEVMPHISTQNFLGLAMRGPLPAVGVLARGRESARLSGSATEARSHRQNSAQPAGGPLSAGFGWSKSQHGAGKLHVELEETVCRFGREYNIHTERIYLAGFDEGGTTALGLMLSDPHPFAGAISICARFPQMQRPLARFPGMCNKRALLVAGRENRKVTPAHVARTARLLHAAGMRVNTAELDGASELTPEMLRPINPWIIADTCHPVL